MGTLVCYLHNSDLDTGPSGEGRRASKNMLLGSRPKQVATPATAPLSTQVTWIPMICVNPSTGRNARFRLSLCGMSYHGERSPAYEDAKRTPLLAAPRCPGLEVF